MRQSVVGACFLGVPKYDGGLSKPRPSGPRMRPMVTSVDALERTRRHLERGDCHQAEQVCRGLVQAEPANGEAWLLLGNVLVGSGRHEEALSCFQQALSNIPRSPASCTELGVALAQLGRLEESAVAFRAAIRTQPE